MTHWLYDEIQKNDPERNPREALQSSINWIRSLDLEITAEHGDVAALQFQSYVDAFTKSGLQLRSTADPALVFEPLFGSLVQSLTLTSMAKRDLPPWCAPGMIVGWYYAFYGAIRAMLAANDVFVETHAKTCTAVGGTLLKHLPHPLNMHAEWDKNDTFTKTFPQYPGVTSTKLLAAFANDRHQSREMLLGYLSGTARNKAKKVKGEILRGNKGTFVNFTTTKARMVRDARFKNLAFNFMHCAYCFRAKTNYRDAIFLAYGSRPEPGLPQLVCGLARTSRCAFLCALAYCRVRLGRTITARFIADVSAHLRSTPPNPEGEELYWKGLPL